MTDVVLSYLSLREANDDNASTDHGAELLEESVITGGSLHPDIASGDFSRVLQIKKQQNLTDHEKYHLLANHFRPTYLLTSLLSRSTVSRSVLSSIAG